eukprot:ctg_901.g205
MVSSAFVQHQPPFPLRPGIIGGRFRRHRLDAAHPASVTHRGAGRLQQPLTPRHAALLHHECAVLGSADFGHSPQPHQTVHLQNERLAWRIVTAGRPPSEYPLQRQRLQHVVNELQSKAEIAARHGGGHVGPAPPVGGAQELRHRPAVGHPGAEHLAPLFLKALGGAFTTGCGEQVRTDVDEAVAPGRQALVQPGDLQGTSDGAEEERRAHDRYADHEEDGTQSARTIEHALQTIEQGETVVMPQVAQLAVVRGFAHRRHAHAVDAAAGVAVLALHAHLHGVIVDGDGAHGSTDAVALFEEDDLTEVGGIAAAVVVVVNVVGGGMGEEGPLRAFEAERRGMENGTRDDRGAHARPLTAAGRPVRTTGAGANLRRRRRHGSGNIRCWTQRRGQEQRAEGVMGWGIEDGQVVETEVGSRSCRGACYALPSYKTGLEVAIRTPLFASVPSRPLPHVPLGADRPCNARSASHPDHLAQVLPPNGTSAMDHLQQRPRPEDMNGTDMVTTGTVLKPSVTPQRAFHSYVVANTRFTVPVEYELIRPIGQGAYDQSGVCSRHRCASDAAGDQVIAAPAPREHHRPAGSIRGAQRNPERVRRRVLLPVPDPARPQIHPLGQGAASRPETEQPVGARQLRPGHRRLWTGAGRGPVIGHARAAGVPHRVRGHAVVSCAGDYVVVAALHFGGGHLVGGLHLCRAAGAATAIPWARLHPPIAVDHLGAGHAQRPRARRHRQRPRQALYAFAAAAQPHAVGTAVSALREPASAGSAFAHAVLPSRGAHIGGDGAGASVPGKVRRHQRRAGV